MVQANFPLWPAASAGVLTALQVALAQQDINQHGFDNGRAL